MCTCSAPNNYSQTEHNSLPLNPNHPTLIGIPHVYLSILGSIYPSLTKIPILLVIACHIFTIVYSPPHPHLNTNSTSFPHPHLNSNSSPPPACETRQPHHSQIREDHLPLWTHFLNPQGPPQRHSSPLLWKPHSKMSHLLPTSKLPISIATAPLKPFHLKRRAP